MNAASGADQLVPGGGGGGESILASRVECTLAGEDVGEMGFIRGANFFFFHASSRSKLFFLGEKILPFFSIYIIVYYIFCSRQTFLLSLRKTNFFSFTRNL